MDAADFWEVYWETRLRGMENLGKREALLAASRLLRSRFQHTGRPARILELGCGEGQIIGPLADAHADLCDRTRVIGLDYNPRSLARCRRDFPGLKFASGDFTDAALLATLGEYDLVLLVNAVHEVFSSTILAETGEVDIEAAKLRVFSTLGSVAGLLAPGGWLLLFDGLEAPGGLDDPLRIRFYHPGSRRDFNQFTREYRPFRIAYRETGDPLCVELSRRDFSRYMTKSIFLGKPLWERECRESYQYYTEAEFRAVLPALGLEIVELRQIVENEEKWREKVRIETPGEEYPPEHIMILARR